MADRIEMADAVLSLCQFLEANEDRSPGHWNLAHNGTVRLARQAAAELRAAETSEERPLNG